MNEEIRPVKKIVGEKAVEMFAGEEVYMAKKRSDKKAR